MDGFFDSVRTNSVRVASQVLYGRFLILSVQIVSEWPVRYYTDGFLFCPYK